MMGYPFLAVLQTDMLPMPEVSTGVLVVVLACVLLMLVSMWIVFEKAGEPGWTAIIPFVNYFFLAKAAGKPAWWGILMFVPIVNIIVWFILCIDLAKRFGEGTLFGVGLALLPIVFFPILAFGDFDAGPAYA
jgi:hypothetical protein